MIQITDKNALALIEEHNTCSEIHKLLDKPEVRNEFAKVLNLPKFMLGKFTLREREIEKELNVFVHNFLDGKKVKLFNNTHGVIKHDLNIIQVHPEGETLASNYVRFFVRDNKEEMSVWVNIEKGIRRSGFYTINELTLVDDKWYTGTEELINANY